MKCSQIERHIGLTPPEAYVVFCVRLERSKSLTLLIEQAAERGSIALRPRRMSAAARKSSELRQWEAAAIDRHGAKWLLRHCWIQHLPRARYKSAHRDVELHNLQVLC